MISITLLIILALLAIVLYNFNFLPVNIGYILTGAFVVTVVTTILVFYFEAPKKIDPRRVSPSLARNDITWVVIGAGVALVIAIILTLTHQYIPNNQIPDEFKPEGSPFFVTVTRDATILVPLRNTFSPINSSIEVTIYHADPNPKIKVLNVKLFSASDTLLSFKPEFTNTTKFYRTDIYKNYVGVQHNLAVSNTSGLYEVRITYLNSTEELNRLPLKFTWPIKTLDLSIVAYLWIVLIGVIASRALSLYISQRKSTVTLKTRDYVWIAFTFIIALLIFSSFKEQVHLTPDIITNISLAFGFGFGFDKVLEVGQKIQSA